MFNNLISNNMEIIDEFEKMFSKNLNKFFKCRQEQKGIMEDFLKAVFEIAKVDEIRFENPDYEATYFFGEPQYTRVLGITKDLQFICQKCGKDSEQDEYKLSVGEFSMESIVEMYILVDDWLYDFKSVTDKSSND